MVQGDLTHTHWHELLRPVIAGRRWLVALDVAAGATGWVEALSRFGAQRPLVLAASRGTGDLPDTAACELVDLDLPPAADMMDGIRAMEQAFAALPDDAVRRIRAWDPDGSARVLGTIFARGTPIDGRAYYGRRPDSWQALDDKTVIDAVWDAAGVTRAPSEIVPPDPRLLAEAAARLGGPQGTIQAGDSREGFHGGASGLRWVRTDAHQRAAATFFAASCDRVRVMPFLEGRPCSIHGIVFPDHVVALRPMEMIILRRPGGPEAPGADRLVYARAASFWDPPDADREGMRAMVRRVGAWLRDTVDYRGPFTIDGVLTADGFRPTELNPRYGAALGVLLAPMGLALQGMWMGYALVEGEALDWRAEALEGLILRIADRNRAGRAGMVAPVRVTETQPEVALHLGADGWREARPDEPVDARVTIGPAPAGSYVSIGLDAERTPVGEAVAPRVAAIAQWIDARFSLGIGPLQAAPDVR